MELRKFFSKEKIILFLIFILTFVLRTPFFNEPLDYDEGTYAFFAFFSQGPKFYSSFPMLKLPGIVFTYRFLDIFFPGQVVAFRVLAAFLLALAAIVVYKLGRLLFNNKKGFLSAIIFILFLSQTALEPRANTEVFMMPFIVFSFYFFWLFYKSQKNFYLFLSGLACGIAFVYKQVAIFDFAFLFLWLFLDSLILKKSGFKNLILKVIFIFSGFLIPIIGLIIFFQIKGELSDFWFNSFVSGKDYVNSSWQNKELWIRFKRNLLFLFKYLWPLFLITVGGLISALVKRRKNDLFLIGWLLFAFFGFCFNGWFFPHYFIQLIPPASFLGASFIYILFNLRIINNIKFFKTGLILILAAMLFFTFKPQLLIYRDFLRMLGGKIDQNHYFKTLGQDTEEAGWLPFYQSSEYLKKVMDDRESLFAWSTTPLPYYLVRRQPTTSFVQNYYFLDYSLMLSTYHGWKFDFENDRKKLIEQLKNKPPEYILLHIGPEQIFDQIFVFPDFGRFVSQNYNFEKKFGNILIFKRASGEKIKIEPLPVIPLELIKYYSAIVKVDYKNNQTEITFEPMVNPNGIVRTFKAIYPQALNIKFKTISVNFLGQDGDDFVGNSSEKPSGVIDFHLQIEDPKESINFIRIKNRGITWNSKSYGVNYALKMIEKNDKIDVYFEPPVKIKGEAFSLYLIYQNGDISKYQFSGN